MDCSFGMVKWVSQTCCCYFHPSCSTTTRLVHLACEVPFLLFVLAMDLQMYIDYIARLCVHCSNNSSVILLTNL